MESLFLYIVLTILGLVNLVSFLVVGYDKKRSMSAGHEERVPEGVLFFLASVFGAIGVFVGMQVFRHKTRKWYFQIGIPLLIIQNIAIAYVFLAVLGDEQLLIEFLRDY